MKKVLSAVVAVAFVTVATSAMAVTIINTKHDLSSGVSGYSANNTKQVCIFCHTPHNSAQTRALWNRNAINGTFKTYTSGANAETAGWYLGTKGTLQTTSPSMLCLSCHDGATNMNNILRPPTQDPNRPLPDNAKVITTNAALGTDLTNDHPIGINYNSFQTGASMAGTLNPVNAAGTGVGTTFATTLPLAGGVSLECNTCHNVHVDTLRPFLRVTMDKSALCTVCHIK